jgi:hypothetical protein
MAVARRSADQGGSVHLRLWPRTPDYRLGGDAPTFSLRAAPGSLTTGPRPLVFSSGA